MKTLDEACKLLPSCNWWIKADGADVVRSLEESVKLEWNGDVDLGDGACQDLHEEYCHRLEVIAKLDTDVSDRGRVLNSVPTVEEILSDIHNDLLFVHDRKYYKQ